MSVPRSEHPKPQFKRDDWINLNGEWDFAFDFGLSGQEQGWHKDPSGLSQKITVPFCPESKLSGINYTDFIPAVWYHRRFHVPDAWSDKKVLLHFGAVDYDCRVWVNGQFAGRHSGGSSSFSFDITSLVQKGEKNQLVVNAKDDERSGLQPLGKQSKRFYSHGCSYTRTTGIWQTVWLEAVPEYYLESVCITPDFDNGCLAFVPALNKERRGLSFRAVVSEDDQPVGEQHITAFSGNTAKIKLDAPRSWCPDDPFLYDVSLELWDGEQCLDRVASYAGLRKFHVERNKFYLNNEPIFLRFVLDQGFYPDGIWTASDDTELKADIQRAQAVGFNGARLHQKVFEERFHYWADRLGYLTWGEIADWGMDTKRVEAMHNHQREWREVVNRDKNHPSIVAWTPFNEQKVLDFELYKQAVQETYALTKALDPTRPINDASGWTHVRTDIYTVHDYDQNANTFEERYAQVDPNDPQHAFVNKPDHATPYKGEPYVIDEYGGTFWSENYAEYPQEGNKRENWGYGKSAEEVEELIGGLTQALLDNPNIAGFTYTQLTDVEQEINGIYTYNRELKFSPERLKEIFGGRAAIEEE